jgi:hypothetical protein
VTCQVLDAQLTAIRHRALAKKTALKIDTHTHNNIQNSNYVPIQLEPLFGKANSQPFSPNGAIFFFDFRFVRKNYTSVDTFKFGK